MIQRSYPIRRAGPVVIAGLLLGTLLSAGLVLAAPLRVGVPSPSVSLPAAHRSMEDGFFCAGGRADGVYRHEAIDHPTRDGEWRNSPNNRDRHGYLRHP